jgi:RNA polymerase sigma factor for flagellar operon FliA
MTDSTARQRLILRHHSLVTQIARRMFSRTPPCVELDDLISIGTMGLIDAADRFDPALGTVFGAYARIRIKGAIVDALRRQDWVPRLIRSRNSTFAEARRSLSQRLGRSPSQSELAIFLGRIGVVDFHSFRSEATVTRLISTEDLRGGTDHRVGDLLTSPAKSPAEVYTRIRLEQTIRQVMRSLAERDQRIVQLYYFDGLSLRAIGTKLDITESRVCQLHMRIRKRLRQLLSARDLGQAA